MKINIRVDLTDGFVTPDDFVLKYMDTIKKAYDYDVEDYRFQNACMLFGPVGSVTLIQAFRVMIAEGDLVADEIVFSHNGVVYQCNKFGNIDPEFWYAIGDVNMDLTGRLIKAMLDQPSPRDKNGVATK